TAAALVDLSTVAGNKISNPPWVKFQSAGWVNFPSAPTEGSPMWKTDPFEAFDTRPLNQLPGIGCTHAVKLDQPLSQCSAETWA
ncbi:hypothetical protein ACRCPZ_32910, partial [Pseudomonas aeruginosa]